MSLTGSQTKGVNDCHVVFDMVSDHISISVMFPMLLAAVISTVIVSSVRVYIHAVPDTTDDEEMVDESTESFWD